MPSGDDVADATLRSIVDVTGGLAAVVTASRGLDVAVGDVVIHDPSAELTAASGDVILGVGVDPTRPSAVDVIARYGEVGAAGVLLRHSGELPEGLVVAAQAAGVALLVAPPEAAWGQLHTILRTALVVTANRDADAPGAPLGDLFGVADALASALGGAVTIEDARSTVLAYSTGPHPIDEARRSAILGRHVGPEWLARGAETGLFRRLASTDEVIAAPAVPAVGTAARLVIGVRAGGELLGSIWVQEGDTPFSDDAEVVLKEAAKLAALHLLKAQSADHLRRRSSSNELGAVLQGTLPPTLLAQALQVGTDAPVVLIGIDVAEDEPHPSGLVRVTDFMVFSATALGRRVVATCTDRVAYVLLPGGGGVADTRRLAVDLVGRARTALRLSLRAAAADASGGVRDLRDARDELDLALRVLAAGQHGDTVHVEDVRSDVVLLQLRDLVAERPGARGKAVQRLAESDRLRGTEYVASLKAFLDSFGDVRAAAESLGVHANTLRHRLRRLGEIADLDLADPAQRLVVALELHLRDVR